MNSKQFKQIRKSLINPETSKATTQTELAELLNCSRDLVAKMEADKTPIQESVAEEMRKLKAFGWDAKYKFVVVSGNGVNNTHRIEATDLDNAKHVYELELQWSLDNVSITLLSTEAKNWENPNYEPEEHELYRVELMKVEKDTNDFVETIQISEEYYLGE